jgi:hypothetical protein
MEQIRELDYIIKLPKDATHEMLVLAVQQAIDKAFVHRKEIIVGAIQIKINFEV